MLTDEQVLTPSALIDLTSLTLESSFPSVKVEGEVASFKINQGKWVFFDLKDDDSSVPCFMTLWNLRIPIEDGMKIVVRGTPKITKWGKFSFTVDAIKPVGEGSLKKAYELLKKKLTAEGLFDSAKKRSIPTDFTKLGVISSTAAAGYADFIKILNARWGGIKVQVAHTQVQGLDAPDQIIRALNYFNEKGNVEVIAILRGGGSADDLSAFNDEKLVRTIAASKIPVITGIGHEIDESLADLAADVRASTPSNAAELLTRDKKAIASEITSTINRLGHTIIDKITAVKTDNSSKIVRLSHTIVAKCIDPLLDSVQQKQESMLTKIKDALTSAESALTQKLKILEILNPEKVLRQGYAILSGKISPGNVVKITTFKQEIKAEIKECHDR